MATLEPKYLLPGNDWNINIILFANGARTTEAEAKAQEEFDKANTVGKALFSIACIVTSLALGIILGLTLHPACFACCTLVIIGMGALLSAFSERIGYLDNLAKAKEQTINTCTPIIEGLKSFRKEISQGSIGLLINSHNSKEDAEIFSNTRKDQYLDSDSNVLNKYNNLKGLLNNFGVIRYKDSRETTIQDQVIASLDQCIYGNASKSNYKPGNCYHTVSDESPWKLIP